MDRDRPLRCRGLQIAAEDSDGSNGFIRDGALVKNRLPALRAEHGWSQGDLADRLAVSRQTINALERGKYDPSLPLAFKIAQLFDLRIEQIFEPDGAA